MLVGGETRKSAALLGQQNKGTAVCGSPAQGQMGRTRKRIPWYSTPNTPASVMQTEPLAQFHCAGSNHRSGLVLTPTSVWWHVPQVPLGVLLSLIMETPHSREDVPMLNPDTCQIERRKEMPLPFAL